MSALYPQQKTSSVNKSQPRFISCYAVKRFGRESQLMDVTTLSSCLAWAWCCLTPHKQIPPEYTVIKLCLNVAGWKGIRKTFLWEQRAIFDSVNLHCPLGFC